MTKQYNIYEYSDSAEVFGMKRIKGVIGVLTAILFSLFSFAAAYADFSFSDTRFQNNFTTENLDAIIDEYELFDGWYWTTHAEIRQDFHGHPESPGWTATVEQLNKTNYLKGWYGCRWPGKDGRRR